MIDDDTGYRAPILFRNGHLQTIYPIIFRKVPGIVYLRERIETPDGDFLDIDWSRVNSKCLAIISHGLEGNSGRAYVRGMVRAVNEARIDALAWNHRGCSGEPNRLLRMYHNGVIDDLERVISHSIDTGLYESVFLVGFSMGGNLSLLMREQASPVSEIPEFIVNQPGTGIDSYSRQHKQADNYRKTKANRINLDPPGLSTHIC